MTFLPFQIMSSKMGPMLKAAEKLIEIQTQALQNQCSKKQNAQPNKFHQQARNQQSGSVRSDQGSR